MKNHLHARDLVVLDATVPYGPAGADGALGRARWRDAHIPASRYADLQGSLSDADAPFSFAFPAAEKLVPALQALGVHDGAAVVIYDDFLNMWATRLWWMLRAIGFTNAAVLDGGWKAWVAAGEPAEAGEGTPAPTRQPLSVHPVPSFVDIEAVQAHVAGQRQDEALVCALPESYFTGQDKVGGRGGHIPGSINIPAASLLDAEGRFLAADALRAHLARLDGASSTTLYCGGGISATVVAFALGLIDREDVNVYDGSLEEWNANPSRPLAVAG
ncbi:rhodanese-like domain-containing protein [Mesorhizobium sp. YC-39]|uniref:sulfurtransferase n=1 Tax=unclassified Mesorhizobium TaxID=325217 RepID=UPI0021E75928|nr:MULTISPECIES: rhodanese-like domain-containing protein [unclassified Mesorhizobium]MCV3205098.1 rhodanese-like domain-containing protein [Mesorhizobium sp. YC-2]MCV3228503.1 rhodanese-like domain-containing protein [Mesorhizobium sp. YC-39]